MYVSQYNAFACAKRLFAGKKLPLGDHQPEVAADVSQRRLENDLDISTNALSLFGICFLLR